MIDIGWDDCPAPGYFVAHELRRDKLRNRRAKAVAWVGACSDSAFIAFLPSEIFPDRDVFHLRGDYTLPGVMHLRNVATRLGAQNWPARCVGKALGLRSIILLNRGLIAGAG